MKKIRGNLYPAIEPHCNGYLEVNGGHRLAYELCGNPEGLPAIFLHGGPGAGYVPRHRRFFDPAVYRIVLFDQRGAGGSTPTASIEHNTTAELVGDIEALRRHLGIRRWLVFGGSWGSTLALAYAAAHPEACLALVLRGIWLCRPTDLDWQFRSARNVFPEYWRDFACYVEKNERADLVEVYFRRLMDLDPAVHLPAAEMWNSYEAHCSTLRAAPLKHLPAQRALALARIEAHFMRQAAFLREGQLLNGVSRFRHVPGVIVHGRYDMLCPLEGAFALSEAWPEAEFHVVADAGHSAWEPGICRLLVAATNRFRHLDDGRKKPSI